MEDVVKHNGWCKSIGEGCEKCPINKWCDGSLYIACYLAKRWLLLDNIEKKQNNKEE